jgi:general secretion pathway protein K
MSVDFAGRRQQEQDFKQEGFIVVAVLWILAALSALVLIYLTYVTNTAVTVAVSTGRAQADALIMAGLELAAYRLTAARPDARPTSGSFDAQVGSGRINVTFRSEAARIDLNAAPKGLLAGLMTGLGAAPSDAAGYADRILAWRAATELGDNDPENSFYRTSGAAYIPRHAPFPEAEELWLVRGIPPPIIEQMLPFVTVFSNMASINVVDAAPQVLAALPHMSPENLQELLAERSDPTVNRQSLLGLSGGEGATLDSAKSYRMNVVADLGGGRRTSADIVILLLDGSEPYRVLSWHNSSDGSAGKPL